MKKIFLYTLIFSLTASCSSNIKLGHKVKNFKKSDSLILSPLGNLINYKKTVKNNITYDIGIKSNTVRFVSTSDSNFKIKNIRIGSTFKETKKTLDSLIKNTSFDFAYIKIRNNWYASFNLDSLTDNSKIIFFFKYKFIEAKEISSKNFKLKAPNGNGTY